MLKDLSFHGFLGFCDKIGSNSDSEINRFLLYELTSSESNYTITEKETLTILKSLSYFNSILFVENITCYTDNLNLLSETKITKRMTDENCCFQNITSLSSTPVVSLMYVQTFFQE